MLGLRAAPTSAVHPLSGVPARLARSMSAWCSSWSDCSNLGGPGRHAAPAPRPVEPLRQPEAVLSFVAVISWPLEDVRNWVHDPCTGRDEHVWREPLCHAHASADGRWWCADQDPYRWDQEPCRVLLLDARSGTRRVVHGGLPPPPVARGPWHLDPHPQISPDGRFVVWMSTARGRCEVAVTPLAQFA